MLAVAVALALRAALRFWRLVWVVQARCPVGSGDGVADKDGGSDYAGFGPDHGETEPQSEDETTLAGKGDDALSAFRHKEIQNLQADLAWSEKLAHEGTKFEMSLRAEGLLLFALSFGAFAATEDKDEDRHSNADVVALRVASTPSVVEIVASFLPTRLESPPVLSAPTQKWGTFQKMVPKRRCGKCGCLSLLQSLMQHTAN